MSDTVSPPPPRKGLAALLDPLGGRTTTVLALLTLFLLSLQWLDARSTLTQIRLDLSRRLGEADALVKQNQSISQQTTEKLRELEPRLATLEVRVADSQNQQVELDALYQELSRSRDDWILAEVEQLVVIANQQLELTGNVQSALSALQAADLRLQKINKPLLVHLRQVLNQDIDRLRALPYVDTTGISIRLDGLASSVNALPLASDTRPQKDVSDTATGSQPPLMQRIAHDLALELGKAVQIRRMDTPELPLLSPDQAFFLRENLKLRLMSARLGALSRNETSYKADLMASSAWLNRYFDRTNKSVQNALDTLNQLAKTSVNAALPDANATLNAVRLARAPHETNR